MPPTASLKPIQTSAYGRLFRSRLEARWAVFFTSPQGLTITARPGPSGQWLVQFVKRGRTTKQLDRCAAWDGSWDEHRWSPVVSRLVPPAALLEVERWLEAQP
jgi:hypothetical protein